MLVAELLSQTLGGHDACPETGATPFSTKLELSTDVGSGRTAMLTVNGQPVATAKVKGSIVTFDDGCPERSCVASAATREPRSMPST